MDLLRADHKREAEHEMGQNHGPNIGVTCPVPPEFVVHLDGSQNVPIGAANSLLIVVSLLSSSENF